MLVMPNHIHGILWIDDDDAVGGGDGDAVGVETLHATSLRFRFHDRIIRNENELNRIRNYIIKNPEMWQRDRNNGDLWMVMRLVVAVDEKNNTFVKISNHNHETFLQNPITHSYYFSWCCLLAIPTPKYYLRLCR